MPQHCTLCVDEESLTWKEGQCLVFDDSFLHSVTHFGETDSSRGGPDEDNFQTFDPKHDRVVLIVDIWHPALSMEEREAIDFVFAS